MDLLLITLYVVWRLGELTPTGPRPMMGGVLPVGHAKVGRANYKGEDSMVELRPFLGMRTLLWGVARQLIAWGALGLMLTVSGSRDDPRMMAGLGCACGVAGLGLALLHAHRCLPLRAAAGRLRAGLLSIRFDECQYVVIFHERAGRYRTVVQTCRSSIWIAGHGGTRDDTLHAVRLAMHLGVRAYVEHADGERTCLPMPS